VKYNINNNRLDLPLCSSTYGVNYSITITCAERRYTNQYLSDDPIFAANSSSLLLSSFNDPHHSSSYGYAATSPQSTVSTCRKPVKIVWSMWIYRTLAIPVVLTAAHPSKTISAAVSGMSHQYMVQVPADSDSPKLSISVISKQKPQIDDEQVYSHAVPFFFSFLMLSNYSFFFVCVCMCNPFERQLKC
jgi:hypothetical protein